VQFVVVLVVAAPGRRGRGLAHVVDALRAQLARARHHAVPAKARVAVVLKT
jgi:hypothetical protein